jgi:peptidoglycan/LPS O-acetylase OafA/YrhL
MLIWLVAIGALVACTRWPDRFLPGSHSGRALLKLAGKVTYPLYLVHGILGAAVMGWLVDLRMPPYVALLAGVAFVVSVATVVALFAEPMMRKPLRMGLDAAEAAAAKMKSLGFLFRRSDTASGAG